MEKILKRRIKYLNKVAQNSKGKYIFYWMQASQRAFYNYALEYTIEWSNRLKKPFFVLFVISPYYPGANLRHYKFMIDGLLQTEIALQKRGIKLFTFIGKPSEVVTKISKNATIVITDMGYTRIQKEWRKEVANNIKCLFIQVESDVIVPVEEVSEHEEYSAATIRNKIKRYFPDYIQEFKHKKYFFKHFKIPNIQLKNISFNDLNFILPSLKIDKTIKTVDNLHGGYYDAELKLKDFIKNKITKYSEYSDDPSKDFQSGLSPYLHFGQISPLQITLEVLKTYNNSKVVETFLEQLIIRRELAINFVHYNPFYDSIKCLPEWAKKTINKHKNDKRKFIYKLKILENGETHDKYWNAAQLQMVKMGKMHGYMRMYWGKKVIEWTRTFEEAYEYLIYLNDKYEIDGRDPNGYAGIAWIFGKHDRAWKERLIFGKLRYMNSQGLERKYNMNDYINMIQKI